MAPTPKPPGQRVRRNANQPQWKTLPAAAPAKPPAAPKRWSKPTRDWWKLIWASPMATQWIEADVPNLLELGDLVELKDKTSAIYGEIRQMRAQYGLTPAARKSLMWNIPPVGAAAAPDEPAPASNVRRLRAV